MNIYTKITLVTVILAILWVLNKVRIVIFGSMWWLVIGVVIIGLCAWLLSGGISRIPGVRGFIDKYGK